MLDAYRFLLTLILSVVEFKWINFLFEIKEKYKRGMRMWELKENYNYG